MKKIPGTFTIVCYIILVAAVLTWIVPGGEYLRETTLVNGVEREIVLDNSFHYVEQNPQTYSVLFSLYEGFVDKADIIVFVLIVGGAFWILNSTKAIDIGVGKFVEFTQKCRNKKWLSKVDVDSWVLAMIMVMFSFFGAVFGMSEETIAFIIIFVPMAISMGYDSITGVCISYLAAHVGFAGAMLNPFTIGIAQGIAGIPLFSGLEYRVFCWLILTAVAVCFVLWYARKVKRNPEKSPVYAIDEYWRKRARESQGDISLQQGKSVPFMLYVVFVVLSLIQGYFAIRMPQTGISIGSTQHILPLLPVVTVLFVSWGIVWGRRSVAAFNMQLFFFTIIYLVIGVLGYQWYMMEISALFLAMGICAGWASGKGLDSVMKLFLEGVKDILAPAMVIGLASGIIFVLQEGRVIDTILHSVASGMAKMGETASVGVMYLFQTCLNLVMPSGSAKAALTMPIMSQFADLIHISRQTTVLAFQFGDGFTNMITPTSGILLGVLGVARIPYAIWVKWVYKFILFLIILGFVLLLPTLFIPLHGF